LAADEPNWDRGRFARNFGECGASAAAADLSRQSELLIEKQLTEAARSSGIQVVDFDADAPAGVRDAAIHGTS